MSSKKIATTYLFSTDPVMSKQAIDTPKTLGKLIFSFIYLFREASAQSAPQA